MVSYREIEGAKGNYMLPPDIKARGHEFHYSTFESPTEFTHAYITKGLFSTQQEGYMKGNLIAGYTHLYFPSCPEMVENWLRKCKERQTHA